MYNITINKSRGKRNNPKKENRKMSYDTLSGIIAYTDRAWEEIESYFEESLEELGKD